MQENDPRVAAIHRFGRCEIRPADRRLLVDGREVHVGRRAFDVLIVLAERSNQLISKDDLLSAAWPGLVVEENNLQVQISTLRKVLGQGAIVTVPGHGYRFALEAAPAPAHSRLPAAFSSFIGREREIADLRERLQHHRQVTLTGPGGIGKTRLAIDVADRMLAGFLDGACFVDLAPVSDPRGVMDAIAEALGVTPSPRVPVADLVADHVRERKVLLVLDNCEHLLEPSARACRALLQAGAGVRILATSREPLNLPGESSVPLAALGVPDADVGNDELVEYPGIALFLDRAAAARPGFALTRENGATVARVCRELDGIPLALELAAARMRTMSVDTLASQLANRFTVLHERDGSVPPRQQTMRAAIDWSHDLLTPQERALFRRLSVFHGSFDLDGAEAVGAEAAQPPGSVLQLLGALVEKSLVVFDTRNDCYRMLETVRQYALERLVTAGESAQARGAHLRYYDALGMQAGPAISSPSQPMWRLRLDRERDNIFAAFAYARTVSEGALAGLRMVRSYQVWLTWQRLDHWLPVLMEAIAHPGAQTPTVLRSHACTWSRTLVSWSVATRMRTLSARRAYALRMRAAMTRPRPGRCTGSASRPRSSGAPTRGSRTSRKGSRLRVPLMIWVSPRAFPRSSCAAWTMSTRGSGASSRRSSAASKGWRSAGWLDPDSIANLYLALARDAIALHADDRATEYTRQAVAVVGAGASITTIEMLLVACAGIAALRSEAAFALRLSGAADGHRQRTGYVSDSTDTRCHEQALESAKNSLDGVAAAAAVAAGRSLTTEAALAEALEWLEKLPRSQVLPA